MAKGKECSKWKIALIVALKEEGKKTKEISEQVRKWCARFRLTQRRNCQSLNHAQDGQEKL